MENFIQSNGALLQQTTLFQKIRKTITQHHSKYKTEAALGGLLLWPGLGPHLGELSRRGLKIFGAFAKGNRLKRLDEKNWPLGMGDWSVTCGPYSLLGCIRVLTFIRLNRLIRIAFLASFSEEVIARVALGPAASTSSGASLTSELGGASSLMAGG